MRLGFSSKTHARLALLLVVARNNIDNDGVTLRLEVNRSLQLRFIFPRAGGGSTRIAGTP